MTTIVILLLAAMTGALSTGFPKPMRVWLWLALLEYLMCAAAQLAYGHFLAEGGGDSLAYTRGGIRLSRFLDQSFSWGARELTALLFQQDTAFDKVVQGAGTNTGSMYGAAGWLAFCARQSEYATQVLVAGLSLFSLTNIYNAFHEAYPEGSQKRLFFATVMFPSVAFWTSAMHKEAFCLMGMGAIFAAWRALSRRKIRGLLYGPVGVALILLFRAPAFPPLLLGMTAYFLFQRMQRVRGAQATVLAPVYLAIGLGILAVAMVLVSRVSPTLGLDQLQETVATQRNAWTKSGGESTFADEGYVDESLTTQLLRVPLAMVNALFRPQLFDVNNILALVSAVEMTAITVLVIRGLRMHGVRGTLTRIQRSPFLVMCTIVTFVGCTFVGLVTLNFGSLARYRVPFLPFYGALVAVLTERTVVARRVAARTFSKVGVAARRRLGRAV